MVEDNVQDPLASQEFDELFLYDQAIIAKFTEGTKPLRIRSREVPIIMGTAQRAFAEIRELYGVENTKRIPLPVGNLINRDIQLDLSRYMSTGSVYGSMRVSEPVSGIQKRMPRPIPVTIQYSLQFRCADPIQVNLLKTQMFLKMSNEKFVIPVTIPDFGSWNMMASHSGILDSSEYDVDEFDKIHVISTNLIYEAFLFYEISIHKMIKGAQSTWTIEESSE